MPQVKKSESESLKDRAIETYYQAKHESMDLLKKSELVEPVIDNRGNTIGYEITVSSRNPKLVINTSKRLIIGEDTDWSGYEPKKLKELISITPEMDHDLNKAVRKFLGKE